MLFLCFIPTVPWEFLPLDTVLLSSQSNTSSRTQLTFISRQGKWRCNMVLCVGLWNKRNLVSYLLGGPECQHSANLADYVESQFNNHHTECISQFCLLISIYNLMLAWNTKLMKAHFINITDCLESLPYVEILLKVYKWIVVFTMFNLCWLFCSPTHWTDVFIVVPVICFSYQVGTAFFLLDSIITFDQPPGSIFSKLSSHLSAFEIDFPVSPFDWPHHQSRFFMFKLWLHVRLQRFLLHDLCHRVSRGCACGETQH